jgi:hypothetical protein
MRKKQNPILAHYAIRVRALRIQKDALIKSGMVTQEHAKQSKQHIGSYFYMYKDSAVYEKISNARVPPYFETHT